MTDPTLSLYDLPDELILETVHHLSTIRTFEPQSTAFREKKKERARQSENRIRQTALHSLCLTSRRIRCIATPALYASFVSFGTQHGYKTLKLFHRTISNPADTIDLKVHVATYIHYVENRLSDYLGNSLLDDSATDDVEEMAAHYFLLLSDIVRHAPNIQHLSIVSLEVDEVSFWRYILPGDSGTWAPPPSVKIASHGLCQLQYLSFQLLNEVYDMSPDAASFLRICSAMSSIPSLIDLRASSVVTYGLTTSFNGFFKNLQRLEITQCVLDFDEVGELWSGCEALRHITCEWAFLDCAFEKLSDLNPGLLRHTKTLETLNLDLREVRFHVPGIESPKSLVCSLRPFKNLKSLAVCEVALFGTPFPVSYSLNQNQKYRIAELLPENLTHLTLLLEHGSDKSRWLIDGAVALSDLAEKCKMGLLGLNEITIRSPARLSTLAITKTFQEVGLSFNIVKDKDR